MNRIEQEAYKDTLNAAIESISKLLNGKGIIDKAIQLELSAWLQDDVDVDVDKVESEVLNTLREEINKIK